jgi:hypothetical protein
VTRLVKAEPTAVGVVEITGVVTIVGVVRIVGVVEIVRVLEIVEVVGVAGVVIVEEVTAVNGFGSEGQHGCKSWNVSRVAKLIWYFLSSQWHTLLHDINTALARGRLTLLVGRRALLHTTHDQRDKTAVVAEALDGVRVINTPGRDYLGLITYSTVLLCDD